MNPDDALVLYVACVGLLALGVFALPTIVAFRRADPNRWLILAFNVSVVGWVVALGLAVYPIIQWVPAGWCGCRRGSPAAGWRASEAIQQAGRRARGFAFPRLRRWRRSSG